MAFKVIIILMFWTISHRLVCIHIHTEKGCIQKYWIVFVIYMTVLRQHTVVSYCSNMYSFKKKLACCSVAEISYIYLFQS